MEWFGDRIANWISGNAGPLLQVGLGAAITTAGGIVAAASPFAGPLAPFALTAAAGLAVVGGDLIMTGATSIITGAPQELGMHQTAREYALAQGMSPLEPQRFADEFTHQAVGGATMVASEVLQQRLRQWFDARAAAQAGCGSGNVTVYRVEGHPNTRVTIGDGGAVSIQGEQMLFLNFGSRERAEQFLAQRMGQNMPGAAIKSFEVSESFVGQLRAAAVPESMARQFPGRPIIVDPTKAPDQFGLRPEQIEALRRAIVPGTGVNH